MRLLLLQHQMLRDHQHEALSVMVLQMEMEQYVQYVLHFHFHSKLIIDFQMLPFFLCWHSLLPDDIKSFQSRWWSFDNFTSLYPWTWWNTTTHVIRYVSAFLQCTALLAQDCHHHTQTALGILKLKESSPSTALEFTLWSTVFQDGGWLYESLSLPVAGVEFPRMSRTQTSCFYGISSEYHPERGNPVTVIRWVTISTMRKAWLFYNIYFQVAHTLIFLKYE
jgi:hypothetical protein